MDKDKPRGKRYILTDNDHRYIAADKTPVKSMYPEEQGKYINKYTLVIKMLQDKQVTMKHEVQITEKTYEKIKEACTHE